MEIITKLDVIGLSDDVFEEMQDGSYDSAISETMHFLSDSYDEEVACGAYLYENYEPENFHFGAQDPEYVKARALAWIPEIQKEFLNAVEDLCKVAENGHMPEFKDLKTDCPETYRVSKAARELDNTWHAYSEHAVYLDNDCGYLYFRVLLTKKQIADILANPEEYVIVDAYVKD